MKKLSVQEEEAMRIVWQLNEGTIKQFWERLPDPKPPYTTFASTIKNLEVKTYIKGRRIGNTFIYHPAIRMEEYKKRFLNEFITDYFKDSYKEVVSFFVEQKKLNAKELKEIIQMIEKNK
jgi:BlaI family penicillinase repressor